METAEPQSSMDSTAMDDRRRGFDLVVFLSMGLLVSGLAFVCNQCHASRLQEKLLNPAGRWAEQDGPTLTWPEQYPTTENMR